MYTIISPHISHYHTHTHTHTTLPQKLCDGAGTSKPLPPALADLAGTMGIRGISEAALRHALATYLRSSDDATEKDNAKLSRYNEEWSDRLNAVEARTAAADARTAAIVSDGDARVAAIVSVGNARIAAQNAEIAELRAKLSVKDTEIETIKAASAAEVTRATDATDARATTAIADATALSKQTAAAAAKLVRRTQSKYAKKAMAARAREGALAGLSVAELKAQTLSVKAKTLSVVRSDIAEEAKFRAKVMDAMTPRLQRIIDMMPRTPDGAYVDPRSAPCVIDDAVNLFN